MTPFLLAAALAAAPAAPAADAQFRSCTELVRTSAERAVEAADAWRQKGGGLAARQCLGLAFAALERWPSAAIAFEQAALEAQKASDARAADFWVQAGNAWLAGDEPAKAVKAFDGALAAGTLAPALAGEVHLDRARAAVAQGDIAVARADLDKGLALVPADPFGWYLSAALARRQNDLPRARADIAKALGLAGDDANVLLEAGNIAGLSGDVEAARALYTKAAKAAPGTPAGRAAEAALAANGTPTPDAPEPGR